ncbi:protein cornichon homolog 4-like [Gastrolobium bilobum]|uniref:protein cornichon homolog 4-like n=1 Tax=Gastrolobium bilobum TaxID=150636 RepID=UPI002AB030F0|nr:protein cornichon homolog 4-like [Gastrolobium bilobum]XP_061348614.1 protein cornichon homolog 4-like [Gastrolobium bilobum]XP_061348615.1 protein cornichon homolog 4-like [Gastrolobium bilobum]
MAEVFYWILTFVLILTLLCNLGYQLILLVDLEFDYINPYDSTSRINQVILPEFITLGIFCFMNLIAGHWFIFLISLPSLYYDLSLYVKREHLTDVTEIYNKVKWEKKKRLFKVAHLLGLFVVSILSLVLTLTEDVH